MIFLVAKVLKRTSKWIGLVLLIMTTHGNSKFKLKEQVALFLKPLTESDNTMNMKKEQGTCIGAQVEENALLCQTHP